LQTDLARGSYIDPNAGKVTLKTYVETRWLPAQLHLRPNSTETYESHLRNHIVPLLGGRHVGVLRRTDMKAVVTALSAKLAPSTVHTVYAVLRAVMQGAVDDGLIPGNPCSRVPLPRLEKRVVTPLPVEAVQALADAITPRYRVTVWLGAGAGLREGEALGLIVPRVEFLSRRVAVVEQMQNRRLSPLKTKASTRRVPLDDVVLAEVTNHLARWPAREPDRLVVTNRCNRPVQRSSFGHCWQAAVEAAGLPKGTRFHDLRHFYASTLIAAGLHPKVIQARLGPRDTRRDHGHLRPPVPGRRRRRAWRTRCRVRFG
jgi:integrase